MKLQLLIPQFNETDEIMRPMLESIAIQQGVDLKNDIEVIIGNDGSENKLSEEFLGSFSFPLWYVFFDHTGLPGTRGKLFDLATADYVMFCDADDMFLTNDKTKLHRRALNRNTTDGSHKKRYSVEFNQWLGGSPALFQKPATFTRHRHNDM